jgi:predicted GNAT superfamily acetyltransferase
MSLHGGTLLEPAGSPAILSAARSAAERAAARAGVSIEMPHTLDELADAAAVWQRVWSPDGEPPVPAEMVRALAHAGNYVSVARAGDRVVGSLLGFFGGNGRVDTLHSHILGVDADMNGRGVGCALKLHQRAWTLAHGIARMTWTYDPLVRRNGHFNLVKLGARGDDYLIDFYGPMPDAINGTEPTDRILLSWVLTADGGANAAEDVQSWTDRGAVTVLDADESGAPRHIANAGGDANADIILCATPPDIVEMRRTDPACAHAWRLALREVMVDAMARGLRPVSMARGGWYVLAR